MKNWIIRVTSFGWALLMLGCTSLDNLLVDRKATLTQKQVSYDMNAEQVTKYLTLSDDKYDSFRDINIRSNIGLTIAIPVDADGSGLYVVRNGARALPVSFECNYTEGETHGELTLSYQDPQNLYRQIYATIEALCVPLSPEEKAAQIAEEQEAEHLAEQQQLAEEQAQAKREAEKKEYERRLAERERARLAEEKRELAIRNSPEFKRDEAQQTIRRLRQQIEEANRSIDEERRVGLVSGYVNATKLHDLGSFIVAAQKEIQRQWRIYKENGGQAASLSEVE